MAIRKIIKTDEEELLRRKSKPVTVFDEKLNVLIEDMKETMVDAQGVGLAAPQIGILRQIIICDIDGEIRPFINPVITETSGSEAGIEGCLSVSGKQGTVCRPTKLTVKAQDFKGKEFIYKAEDFSARVLCHEIDHLNGILYIDKAENIKES